MNITKNSIIETTKETKADYDWQPSIPVGTIARVWRKRRNGELRVSASDNPRIGDFTVNINDVKLSGKQSNAMDYVKPGDIFVSSWGYEQTNIDFYLITAVTAKSVKACIIDQTKDYSKGCGMSGTTLPDPSHQGEVKQYKINFHGDTPFFKPMSFACASKWNGEEIFFSEWH